MLNFKKDFEKALFLDAMERLDARYDPAVRLMTEYRGKNGYHSKLSDCTVHGTRASFEYARLLLCRDAEGDRARAADVLYRALPLQDINPARPTYGIWAYFWEEDLEEMDKPDWNWAYFNAELLLAMLGEHREKLSDDLAARMTDSVRHACRSIIRRNVGPGYTNISVKGAYVTLYAGEQFGDAEFFDYGRERLKKLYEFNFSHGSFAEFNSPTYTFECLRNLADIEHDVKDEECRRLAHELSGLAWETVAFHYHPATAQLAGPHYRAYSLLLENSKKLSIERALDYRIRLIEDYGIFEKGGVSASLFTSHLSCPEKYIPYFTGVDGERVYDMTYAPGSMAYTYMNERFTLGSLRRETTWNQHRDVLGYFGTAAEPIGFSLRCTHDFWDYASGVLATVQDKGRTLSVLGFATDQGDTHCNLDMVKNATIAAEDLRFGCVFGGAVQHLTVTQCGPHTFRASDGRDGTTVQIDFPYAVFGEEPVQFEIRRAGGQISVDAVFYHGPRKNIDFRTLGRALVVTAIGIAASPDAPAPTASASEDAGRVRGVCGNLEAAMAPAPAPIRELVASIEVRRDGAPYVPAY